MRVMRHDDIGAQLQEFQIAFPGIGTGHGGKFFAAVGDNDAPAAGIFDFADSCGNCIHIIPAENPGLCRRGRNAFCLVCDAEHADAAGFLEINRLRCLGIVHAGTYGAASHGGGKGLGALYALDAGIHGMVVPDAPDIGVDGFQHAGSGRIHAVKEDAPRAIVLCAYQRTLHIGDDMICTMEKIQHRRCQKLCILPSFIHVAVKADITGEYNRSGFL